MIERRLLRQLERVAARLRHRRVVAGWIAIWFSIAAVGGCVLLLNWLAGWYVPFAAPSLMALGLAATLLVAVVAYRSVRGYRSVAQRIEQAYPELHDRLLAAIDQRPPSPGARFGFMQDRVIQQVLSHAYRHTWLRVVPPWQLLLAHLANFTALACLAVVTISLWSLAKPPLAGDLDEEQLQLIRVQGDFEVVVEPGDTEVERGTGLLVLARFRGALPPEARLVFATASGATGELAMSKSLDDPVFGGRIADVTEDLAYHIEFADQKTEEYWATVFEYPRLERADAKLVFPEYTAEAERLVQDVRSLSAVEGTELTLICRLNKPVAEAVLRDSAGAELPLAASGEEPTVYSVTMQLERSRRFDLRLVDAKGRENKQPAQFVINVLPNKPPDLNLVQPSRDVEVSPLEELLLKANAWDDYGLRRLGLTLAIGGGPPQEVVLAESLGAKERVQLTHLVFLEDLEAEPDQLLAYHFWAEDADSQGQLRRTASDMFFAEVRHFEEIFRQGQQPPGGQSPQSMQGNAGAAQQLGELQKEIINATWKVIRREIDEQPSSKFAEDIELILDSQATALQQADAVAERLEDPQSQQHIQDVRSHMLEALAHLSRAQKGPELDSLQPALSSEQAAYQALLKLRAREHQVMRSRQGASASGQASSRSRQQLEQLELTEDENRYETQRTAPPEEEEEMDRENRQILNRLRELARRQSDLNERLKELRSALQEAQTEQEREEIRRQLKRLQEEQEQILRDTDELQSRMERPANQEEMSQQRQQLEQTRQNVRQASQALEQGQVSQAVSSGTRAQREFEELREEFRRRASGRFDEEMREMRQQAQQLDETQQQLEQQLDEVAQPEERGGSLRDVGQREQISEALREQRGELDELLERMRDTIQEAETSEPLLAEQLYDTTRRALQQNLDRSLETAAQALDLGFLQNAQQEQRDAREGIRELREGVEQAAESVLGDETEALRRARDALQLLERQLSEEIDRNNPQPDGAPQEGAQPAGEPTPQAEQPDQEGPQEPGPPPGEASSPSGQPGPPNAQGQPSQQPGDSPRGDGQRRRGLQNLADRDAGGGIPQAPDIANFGTGNQWIAPLTGDDFLDWSDRLRDVEEMVEDPELRAEAARIRDRARGIRMDVKRHSQEPNWDLVRLQVARPLAELRNRVREELLRRAAKDAVVPIDRDPVPPKYSEQVRRYYERLGSGR